MHKHQITLEEFYIDLANTERWCWLAQWWPDGGPSSVIVGASDLTYDAKNGYAPCPHDILSFGWNGSDAEGRLIWLGWDLDVGHGAQQYESTDLALVDAFRLRHFLRGNAEIRLSKSGSGVHVRHRLPENANRPASDGPRIAKAIAAELGMKADPSALGRQAFWMWSANTSNHSFRLILPHEGIEP